MPARAAQGSVPRRLTPRQRRGRHFRSWAAWLKNMCQLGRRYRVESSKQSASDRGIRDDERLCAGKIPFPLCTGQRNAIARPLRRLYTARLRRRCGRMRRRPINRRRSPNSGGAHYTHLARLELLVPGSASCAVATLHQLADSFDAKCGRFSGRVAQMAR